jgi:predicted RecB family nuclease
MAERILQRAEALETKSDRVLVAPVLPANRNLVMFDLEGMPPYFDDLEKVYLWGLQVFGQLPTEFFSSVSGFGPDGDREGWFGFLRNAGNIFANYGDLPFVHWAPYEKTKIDLYLGRYGDIDGTATRIQANLFDLLTVTRDSMVLPLPSLSLKLVEKHVGFRRSQTEYGGDWAMATFIEATETNDEGKRRQLMDDILKYNKEDLRATWAVFEWLRLKVQVDRDRTPSTILDA